MTPIAGHGYIIDGHDHGRATVLQLVQAALVDAGIPAWDAEDQTVDRPGLVVRAWWCDNVSHAEAGYEQYHEGPAFVQEHHADAQAVTVVNIEPPEVAP